MTSREGTVKKQEGKVAFITGGGRGQGRSHAVTLAQQGADIVVCDIAHDIDTIPYPLATEADLDETKALVEKEGQRCIAIKADTRSSTDMHRAVERCIEEYG